MTVGRPLAVVEAVNTATPATYWVSVDHLNRPVKMTNSTKASVWDAAVWDAVWQPWGGAHSFTGAATLDARFPGRWFQAETGLHYNWHRSYDPTLGRYTQPDPLGFINGPSVYGYADGSPLRYVDKDGRQAVIAAPPPAWPFLIPPAVFCSIYPDKCRRLLELCLRVGGGGRSPPPPKDEEDKCYKQLDADELYCRTFANPGRQRAACRNQARERYAACLRGQSLPPLTF